MLIEKHQFKSMLTVVRSICLPKQFQIDISSLFLEIFWSFWLFKMFVILINIGLLNFATIFLLFWLACSLVLAKKERFFFLCFSTVLKFNLLAVLLVKVWFSTRFHNMLWYY